MEARATAMFWLEGHTITEVLFEGDVTTLYRGYRDVDGASGPWCSCSTISTARIRPRSTSSTPSSRTARCATS